MFGQVKRTIATTHTTGTSTRRTRNGTTTTATTATTLQFVSEMKNLSKQIQKVSNYVVHLYLEVLEGAIMAQYNHLPIYKTSYDLLLELIQVTKNFPREYRYSLGEKIDNHLIDLIVTIYKANSAKNKEPFLQSILEHVQFINLFLRISCDIKIIPLNRYANFIEKTSSIAKQATAWKNSKSPLFV